MPERRNAEIMGVEKPIINYSVIIPTLNQSAKLKQCLSHLSLLSFDPGLFEVLVIDNGSTDDTKQVVDTFKNEISNLRYFFSDIPGLHTGRNLGFEKARGEILCYIDDDSFVTKGWLKGIERAFEDPSVALVGGPCLPKYESEPPKWLKYFWSDCEFGKTLGYLSLLDFGNKITPIPPGYIFGCNFNIRKDVLLKYKGFPPDFFHRSLVKYSGSGESDVAEKIRKSNLLSVYSSEAKIFHLVPQNRFNEKYLYQRAYEAGVRASYKNIRERYYDIENKKENMPENKRVFVVLGIKKIGRFILKSLRRPYQSMFHKEHHKARKIRKIMLKGWEDGFAFHQNEVKKDPKLLEWVLRENYLGKNGELPVE
ncbi:unnamed protein product [marine sediment metagenome]|uniref:Glycosyltransferase 2-like domain-containing protein n=1 Tax=marine sediment metagenome TaxID=412755 RepID=X1S0S7_9ZZZZ